jgi:hypothetical protein
MKSIFLSAITITGKPIGAGVIQYFNISIFNKKIKRSMFTKGNHSMVLKKSGEIMINTSFKNDTILKSPISSPRMRLNSLIDTPIIKNISQAQNLAHYNKINTKKLYYTELMDCKNYKYNMEERSKYLLEFCSNLQLRGEVTDNFMLNYTILLTAIQRGVKYHTAVINIVEETPETVTFSYYPITTNAKSVNFGDGRVYNTILLYTSPEGKNFFIVPVLFVDKMPKTDYVKIFVNEDKQLLKDTYELRENLVNNIRKVEKTEVVYELDVRQVYETPIRELNISTVIKIKDPNKVTTPLVDTFLDTIIFNQN